MATTPAPPVAPPKPTWDPQRPQATFPWLRPTIRIRLTLLYGGMFLIAGILLLSIIYLLAAQAITTGNQPPFKIVGPDVLLALAERSSITIADVEDALSRYPRQRDQVDVVFAAIDRALDLPESELPTRAVSERTRVSAAVHRRVEALRAWRDEQARASQLDPSTVLSQRLIDRLALAAPRTLAELAGVEGLRHWRVTEWGPALLTACA